MIERSSYLTCYPESNEKNGISFISMCQAQGMCLAQLSARLEAGEAASAVTSDEKKHKFQQLASFILTKSIWMI